MSPRATTILQRTFSRTKLESIFAYLALFCITLGLILSISCVTAGAASGRNSLTNRPTQFALSGSSETITYVEYDNRRKIMELAGNLAGLNMDLRL
ncbi:MAG: hypothetical protein ACOC49_04645, partial [Candidatus Bipolaricaulota bacterium]